MKQSKLMSLAESVGNIGVGLGVAMVANAIILPMVGFDVSLQQNAIIAAFMTVVSLVRSYALRRLFEALHIRHPVSPFIQAVAAERRRQIEIEGWDAAHDDAHHPGELASAGAAYARQARLHLNNPTFGTDRASATSLCPNIWPWDLAWWKPVSFRRDLVKAAALIIADGERHDRNRKRGES